jgi:hypothetical protein
VALANVDDLRPYGAIVQRLLAGEHVMHERDERI